MCFKRAVSIFESITVIVNVTRLCSALALDLCVHVPAMIISAKTDRQIIAVFLAYVISQFLVGISKHTDHHYTNMGISSPHHSSASSSVDYSLSFHFLAGSVLTYNGVECLG